MEYILDITQTAALNLSVTQIGPALIDVLAGSQVTLEVTPAVATQLEVIQALPMQLEINYGMLAGISEEDMAYADRADMVGTTLIYRGQAAPGALESAGLWRIRRLTIGTDDDVTTEWADGNANFDNIWADRAALSYA